MIIDAKRENLPSECKTSKHDNLNKIIKSKMKASWALEAKNLSNVNKF